MLEKMSDFFENRLDGYDEHMLNNIQSAREFYPFTADNLPKEEYCRILDLGCGTGLELEYYFELNPTAAITGIDLAPKMLEALKNKFRGKCLNLISDSYFDVPFGSRQYDAAVSVESLHHYTAEEKTPLYKKLLDTLKDGGYFILTDYFALSDEEEKTLRSELIQIKAENKLTDSEFYHFDTPLTVPHEIRCLYDAGFAKVEVLNNWGATFTLKAYKTL